MSLEGDWLRLAGLRGREAWSAVSAHCPKSSLNVQGHRSMSKVIAEAGGRECRETEGSLCPGGRVPFPCSPVGPLQRGDKTLISWFSCHLSSVPKPFLG